MEYCISHQSALEYWRKVQAKGAQAGKKLRANKPSTKPMGARELCLVNIQKLSTPLHILVGGAHARRVARDLRCHIGSRQYPYGSFIKVASGVAVSSPELCFIQMATELSLIELIELGYEFCGTYRLDRINESEQSFRKDLPLTNIALLNSYVSRASGQKGRVAAQKAIRFIADNSASPMETILALLLTLPYRLGGYGFATPLLNCHIEVPGGAGRKTAKSQYYCDLYWSDAKVAVEYDSDAFHALPDRIAKDAIRRNALLSIGVTVITVTRKQIKNTAELRNIAHALSKLLDKRLQQRMPEFTARHAELRNLLLRKVSSSR